MQYAEIFPAHAERQSEARSDTNRVLSVEGHFVVTIMPDEAGKLEGPVHRRVIEVAGHAALGLNGDAIAIVDRAIQQALRRLDAGKGILEPGEGMVVAQVAEVAAPFESVVPAGESETSACRDGVLWSAAANAVDVATGRQVAGEHDGVAVGRVASSRELQARNHRTGFAIWRLGFGAAECQTGLADQASG